MFVLGVDGGQTSLKCVIMDAQGNVVAQGSGDGLVHLANERGADRLASALEQAVRSAWQQADLTPRPFEAAVLGLATVEDDSPEAQHAAALAREALDVERVVVCSDAQIALLGAHGGGPGVIVIAGTGSHVRGMNTRGEVARAGGWGWLLGDEGSGMWIGRAGVQAACRALDGTGEPTRLVALLCDSLGLEQFNHIKRLIYRGAFGAKEFAALAPIVDRAARQGDAVALRIFEDAGALLAQQVRAVFKRLDLPPTTPVAAVGGAFEHLALLLPAFKRALRRYQAETPVVEPRHSPAVGAALKALQLAKGV